MLSKKGHLIFLFFIIGNVSLAQVSDTVLYSLPEVKVRAYEHDQRLRDVAAPVNFLGNQELERFGPQSVVMAVNTTAGVRMEERSPGSYRINIRGSSLRSPFGVRNVKVYYNDIPVTDPGGHTFLNQLGYYNFRSVEIIKGPASSLYGAGTGGALLIRSAKETDNSLAAYSTGSYNLHNVYGRLVVGKENKTLLSYQHQQSNGYRDHSELKRQVFSFSGNYRAGDRGRVNTTFLYGNLFYETPGALTLAGYTNDPRSARPGSPVFPSAEEARASITQKQVIAGASYEHRFNSELRNKSVFYGMFTDLRNPNIQAYDHSREPHFGGRTIFSYDKQFAHWKFNVDAGVEIQRGFQTVSVHDNNQGKADSLRSNDDIDNIQSLAFVQLTADLRSWMFTLGSSINSLKVNVERFSPLPTGQLERKFKNQFAPRFTVMKKFKQVNLYAGISKGFSPPTTSELLPTGGEINLALDAETGVNYDLGVKGTLFNKLYADVNAFMFSLSNTIVQRRTAGGGDYYLNAGKTRQHGIETQLNYPVLNSRLFTNESTIWLSHTWHDFKYRSFMQLDNDFSGKQMPSEAPHVISAGFNWKMKNGLEGTFSYYYSDKIPLNDANAVYADSYQLSSIRIGYSNRFNKMNIRLNTGVENVFNEKYSLGNDINGFGGRYFNVAPGRNYFAGIEISL